MDLAKFFIVLFSVTFFDCGNRVVSGASNKLFGFINLPILSLSGENNSDMMSPKQQTVKVFNGFHSSGSSEKENDGMYMVYYHDLAVAVVKIGPNKLLIDCSIIEIYNPNDVQKAMGPLLAKTTALPISFDEMIHLMEQCSNLDEMKREQNQLPNYEERKNSTSKFEEARQLFHIISSGIVPGTKWCGTGDLAENYNDLGDDVKTDRCCRNHDLCPTKVMGNAKKFNLENDSPYTRSHCICDDMFYNCMSRQNTRLAQVLGQIYFNVIGMPCIQDGKRGKFFRKPRRFQAAGTAR